MPDKDKIPSVEELTAQVEELKKNHEEEVASLKKELDEQKRLNAQYSILGATTKVDTKANQEEEPTTFDFDL